MRWFQPYIVSTVLATGCVMAQTGGAFSLQKKNGLDFIQYGKYDRAAAELEPIWESGEQDPVIAENLAIAYLNGEERRYQTQRAAKGYELMKAALAKGGKATFLVTHSHERFDLLTGGSLLKFCSGRLSIANGILSYTSDSRDKGEEHSFEVKPADIKELKPIYDKGRGMFTLKATNGSTGKGFEYKLLPRTWDAKDTEVLIALLNQHVLGRNKE